jgi:hypothetical protein
MLGIDLARKLELYFFFKHFAKHKLRYSSLHMTAHSWKYAIMLETSMKMGIKYEHHDVPTVRQICSYKFRGSLLGKDRLFNTSFMARNSEVDMSTITDYY